MFTELQIFSGNGSDTFKIFVIISKSSFIQTGYHYVRYFFNIPQIFWLIIALLDRVFRRIGNISAM